MKTTKRIAAQADATGEQQLAGFIKKFDSKNAALIRSVRKVLRERLPTANARPSDRPIASCPLPQARMELGCRSTAEPRSPILISNGVQRCAGSKSLPNRRKERENDREHGRSKLSRRPSKFNWVNENRVFDRHRSKRRCLQRHSRRVPRPCPRSQRAFQVRSGLE
jgi:hypothetical protein